MTRPTRYAHLFGLCLIAVNGWAFLSLFAQVPSWLLNHDLLSLIGQIAYILLLALLESVLLFLVMLAASALLPYPLWRNHLATQSAVFLLLLSAWAIAGHTLILRFSGRIILYALLSAVLLLVAFAVSYRAVRIPALRRRLNAAVERLAVLAALYLVLDVIAAVIVIARNLA